MRKLAAAAATVAAAASASIHIIIINFPSSLLFFFVVVHSFIHPSISSDPPTVSVHLANEDPSRNITRAEGQNVTLKCRADARPPVTSFGWFKNVSFYFVLSPTATSHSSSACRFFFFTLNADKASNFEGLSSLEKP